MTKPEPFDPLLSFAELERLVAKIYFRFSHLFLSEPELRDFWWEMAREEEQHACILQACRAVIENYKGEYLDPNISRSKARQLRAWLESFVGRGTAALTREEAFRTALQIESSEIDAIYSKLVQLGGPQIAITLENLGVPASVQRQKLKAALRRYCTDPELLKAAEML